LQSVINRAINAIINENISYRKQIAFCSVLYVLSMFKHVLRIMFCTASVVGTDMDRSATDCIRVAKFLVTVSDLVKIFPHLVLFDHHAKVGYESHKNFEDIEASPVGMRT